MKKLYVYITKQLFVSFLLVTFCLMSILWLTQSLKFVDLITNKGLPIGLFLKLTSLLMPRLFSVISPIALFVGTLFVYNRMLTDRELVAVKSAGINHFQIAKPVFFVGIVLSFFSFFVSNVAISSAEKSFSELEWQIKNDVSHLMFRAGEFNSIQNGLTVFIKAHEKDGSISGILINDDRKQGVKSTTSAERGIITYNDDGPRILLVNGFRQEITEENNQFVSISFDTYSVDFEQAPSSRKKPQSAREKTLKELLGALDNNDLTDREKNRFFLEGNKRLVSPLFNFVFILIASTGLIVSSFNRRGQDKVIIISICSMVLVQALELVLTSMTVKNLNFLGLYYANLLLPLFVCIYLLIYYNPSNFRRKKEIEDLVQNV